MSGSTTNPSAPIPRGEQARERVLRAVLDLLAEQGFAGFSMEAVAARARASKSTVYRRWSSQAELMVDAMELASRPLEAPRTGDLRTDLTALVTALHAHLSRPPLPQLLAAFVDAAERDPALASVHTRLTEQRRDPLRSLLLEARASGGIRPDADVDLAVDLLAAPAFYRRFIAHQPFPPQTAETLVDMVLAALVPTR
jgi:AcrR family transcriptional regulator